MILKYRVFDGLVDIVVDFVVVGCVGVVDALVGFEAGCVGDVDG